MSLDKLPDHPDFPEFLWVPLLQPWGPAHPGRLKAKNGNSGEGWSAGGGAVWALPALLPCSALQAIQAAAMPPGPLSTSQFFLGQHRPQGDR